MLNTMNGEIHHVVSKIVRRFVDNGHQYCTHAGRYTCILMLSLVIYTHTDDP